MSEAVEKSGEMTPVKRALLEIRELRAQLERVRGERREPIAIVGAGLRLPGGVADLESFRRLLWDGVDAITEIPRERWDVEAYYDEDQDAPGKMYTRHGGFLDDIDQFDAAFFGISPLEARTLDPQQRLLLETAWEALERAGQSPAALMNTQTGVFLGISSSDYHRMVYRFPDQIDPYFATGTFPSTAAGRLSYVLGLRGPAVAVDTACSSSLTAIHLACASLRNRECDLALAGGANTILAPEMNINFSKAGMMARDGKCKTFDAAADGYVRGEGVAMIALRRLSDAVARREPILAVVRGSAINQDGRSSGLTAPNGPSQVDVVRAALRNAGVDPADVQYVETHGTGTPLGDPIEVRALGEVFGPSHSAQRPLMIGSVKTNVGHTEACAGVAGLLKAALCVGRGEIPPHLHLREINPHIAAENFNYAVPTERTPWPVGAPRIAGVSSFGFSGTNAHVVIEAAPEPAVEASEGSGDATEFERPLHVLPLSARDPKALDELTARFAETLETETDLDVANVCFTAAAGRSHFEERLAVTGATREEIVAKLKEAAASPEAAEAWRGRCDPADPPPVVFLYTGQGAQYVGMGRQFYATDRVFREAIDACAEILKPILERPLTEVLFDGVADEAGQPLLDRTDYTQPATFALQWALTRMWRSWGVEPEAVLGHSAGEVTAATVAGVLSLEDGLRLAAERGRLMQREAEGGLMAAVKAGADAIEPVLREFTEKVSIAAYNGPASTVISGEDAAVREVVMRLEAEGVEGRVLNISIASHSPRMEPMLEEYEAFANKLTSRPPRIGLMTNLTGEFVPGDQTLSGRHWRTHVRRPVQFAQGMRKLHEAGYRVFVEMGPAPVLCGMGEDILDDPTTLWAAPLRRDHDEWRETLGALAALYARGAEIDWEGFDADSRRRRISLPTYPFQRRRYWFEALDEGGAASGAALPAAKPEEVWKSAERAAREQAAEAPLDMNAHNFPEKWQALDALATQYILRAVRQLGMFAEDGRARSVDDLTKACGVQEGYRHLLRRWLDKLAAEGLLEKSGESYMARGELKEGDVAEAERRAAEALRDYPELMDYARRCGPDLAEIVTGRQSALETLFPGGSMDEATRLYSDSVVGRYFNFILREALRGVLHADPARKRWRILEIGAGTGSTARWLVPEVPADRSQYVFTDVSEIFLNEARQRFAGNPAVTYRLLDIERDPAQQDFPAGAFDVVVAANVLHATKNIEQTVDHVRTLLAPGGILLLYEAGEHLSYFDVTTGLIEGWQIFDDTWRDDNPLLDGESWLKLLAGRGFVRVAALPESSAPTAAIGQSVILAQAPGEAGTQAADDGRLFGDRTAEAPPPDDEDDAQRFVTAAAGFLAELEDAVQSEREDKLVEFVRARVSAVLRLATDQAVERRQRLMDLGFDSLMAVQLRNQLTRGLGLNKRLPATLVFDYPTVEAIAQYLSGLLFADAANGAQSEVAEEARQGGRATEKAAALDQGQLDEMSDEEAEAMLLKRLEDL